MSKLCLYAKNAKLLSFVPILMKLNEFTCVQVNTFDDIKISQKNSLNLHLTHRDGASLVAPELLTR